MRPCLRRPAVLLVIAAVASLLLPSCSQPGDKSNVVAAQANASGDTPPPLPLVRDDAQSLLFSFVDANGRVLTVPAAAAVPEGVRKRVLVVDLEKTPEQRQAHRYAFFADLTQARSDGTYPVVVVSRYDASRGANAPAALPPPEGSVVIYSAAWCGYCKKAKAWMKEHEVAFLERDVDTTPGAAAELAAKLKAAGVAGGGIPVTDWGGTLVVGYDLPAFERLSKKP